MRALADAVAPMSWPGLWPGRVVDDQDPLTRGRVRVRVEQVYGDPLSEDESVADADLPWAYVNSLVSGRGTGQEWTPPIGAAVFVAFWGGDGERPIVMGAWHPGAGSDDRIPEHRSSYTGGPKTRVVRTDGGQVFEMRWKPSEEKIRLRAASGAQVLIDDAAAEGGVFIEISTPAGFKVRLDETLMQASVQTPAQQRVTLDDVAQTISIVSPGIVNLSAAAINQTSTSPAGTSSTNSSGLTVGTFTGLVLQTFLGALTYAITGAWLVTVTGAASLSAVGLLSLFGSAVVIGTVAATKFRLLDERSIAVYNAHTHTDPQGGVTGPPSVPLVAGTHTTTDTRAS